jgi:deoxyribose-phosphate aldolase
MKDQEILSHIDHTLLKAISSWAEIRNLCDEAVKYNTASVCVPPAYVKRIKTTYPNLNVCTVIGFPLGYNTIEVKASETRGALKDGAGEIDMVINLGDVKNDAFDDVAAEILLLRKMAGDKILKVIVETCYLTEAEKIKLCHIVTECGADYIKTSTGFGTGGAKIEDICLFKKYLGPQVKIKAAGGVKTREDLELFLKNGADRIGTSSAVKLLTGGN